MIAFLCPRSCPALLGQKVPLPVGKTTTDDFINQLIASSGAGVTHLAIQDASLFKKLTGLKKVVGTAGYVFPSKYGNYQVAYIPPSREITLDKRVRDEAQASMDALTAHLEGRYVEPGSLREVLVHRGTDFAEWLPILMGLPVISVDIETTGLKHHESDIRTIGFGISDRESVVFEFETVRGSLREFFERYAGTIVMHKGAFDLTQLIHKLWMKSLSDTEGLVQGLFHLQAKTKCSLILSYVITNTCAGNELGLKPQVQSVYGNYGIEETWKAPLEQIIPYNGTDCAATLWLYEKHLSELGDLAHVYERLNSYLREIVWMQLTGLPINQAVANKNAAILTDRRDELLAWIKAHPMVEQYMVLHRQAWADKKNSEWKKKRTTPDKCDEEFNPGSHIQLQRLLFNVMGLPILSLTKTKQPATDGDTLGALQNHAVTDDDKNLLKWLVELSQVDKLISSFVPHFVNAPEVDGWHCLYGFYNIGGTQSGRLSSDSPNQQNLPSSGNDFAKYIKEMVEAPEGWWFVGADFSSLEDKIITLLSRDPNRIKVYTDGYDGHSLRAFYYFRTEMPDIVETVESINSIGKKYKKQRQLSKAPTFALTYFGTWSTLVKNCGFSEEVARAIENNYHVMYQVTDEWNAAKLALAAENGYTTLAFGLRLLTPVMKAGVQGRARPKEASDEERSAGNAFGQSYGLLNSRAAHAFADKIIEAKLWNDIKPAAQIHDAQYYWVRKSVKLLKWVNDNLIPEMEWDGLPELQHPVLKLGGNLIVYSKNWSTELTIPNGANYREIGDLVNGIDNANQS
jgi:DNA polymerase-1